jgi:transglutaminase-like putative cysteine protease
MIYDVRQTTSYAYASSVSYARHVLRLTPIDRNGQRVQASVLDIRPAPADRREGQDFFGNRLTWIVLEEPHDQFSVQVAGRLVVEPPPPPGEEHAPAWEAVRDQAFAVNDIGPTSPAHFLFPSRQAPLDAEIRAYVEASFTPGRPIVAAAAELMRRIAADLVYQVGATDASTQPSVAFSLRRGVCQDFAHIMISGLRGIGVPAAYVSGYLRTVPPSGVAPLQGADAMHAWVLVWCGQGTGWVGLDPTNAMFANDSHIVVAIGRDYSDIAPIDGVVFGSGVQQLKVSVSVTPVSH